MATSLVKLRVRDLQRGMYIAQLDRPWLETPFLFQGFAVRGPADIETLAHYCEHVFIDVELGLAPARQKPAPAAVTVTLAPGPSTAVTAMGAAGTQPRRYRDAVPMQEELPKARQVRRRLMSVIEDVMAAATTGAAIDSTGLREAVTAIVDSVVRNADAMAWLTQLREQRNPAYRHAINCAVWMIVFGRSLGLDRGALENLAMIGLLFDVGKSRLPRDLLARTPPLAPADERLFHLHVDYGVEILQKSPDIDRQIIAAVRSHHERFDGSGYPQGLEGSAIPVFGSMAGIVDWYETVVRPYDGRTPLSAEFFERQAHRVVRPYDGRTPLSSIEAIEHLHRMRSRQFQKEIVDQFVQALGVYPTGTLVELNSGEVGVVIAQNRRRRLQPKVIVVTNPNKEPLKAFEAVDLLMQNEHRSGGELRIVRSLKAGAYGIDPAELYI